jgi:predicted porin
VANVRLPINYDRTTAGISTSWRPFRDLGSLGSRLVLNSGYEYRDIKRENAVFVEDVLTADQAATKANQLQLRATMNWSEMFSSYSRYRVTFIDDPLYAVPIRNTTTNTNLPTQNHHLEFGSTWSPTYTFMLTGLFGVNSAWNRSDVAQFDEDNYDLVFTAWYNPLPRWSVSGGMAFYSNWIDQDITLGSKLNPITLPWEYGGRSDVLNFGTSFAWTERLSLNGTVDFVRGRNAFDQLVPWPELNSLSDVNVETTRLSLGADYVFGPRTACYARYQLFDYDDRAGTTDGGTAEMIMLGASAFY